MLPSPGMSRGSEPRRHHYVPRLLLAGFTANGSAEGFLWVHNIRKHDEPWRQRPRTVAHERDFYRTAIEGEDPFLVEKALAEIEGQVAPIIREIQRTLKLPDAEALQELLYFVALLATRVPSLRESLSKFFDQLSRTTLDLASATPERFEHQKALLHSKGYDVDGLEWQDVRASLEPGAGCFGVDQTWLIGQALQAAETIMKCLIPRHWGLMIASHEMPDFVCSDNPVSLAAGFRLSPPMTSPGFGLAETAVLVPLTRRIVLVGRFEETPPLLPVSKQQVARMNSLTIMYARQWVFSPARDFIWLKPDGTMGHATDLREVESCSRSD